MSILNRLRIYSGEKCSKSTKEMRTNNLEVCDDKDKKKTIIDRKIDHIMSSTGVKQRSSEWKKGDTAQKVTKEKRIKNARVNRVILGEILN